MYAIHAGGFDLIIALCIVVGLLIGLVSALMMIMTTFDDDVQKLPSQDDLNEVRFKLQEIAKHVDRKLEQNESLAEHLKSGGEVATCPQCETMVPAKELTNDYICHNCRGV